MASRPLVRRPSLGERPTSYPLSDGRFLRLRGKVDRIDQLSDRGALGVVDYKSSLTQFHYDKFFNGLNSQLPTYLLRFRI